MVMSLCGTSYPVCRMLGRIHYDTVQHLQRGVESAYDTVSGHEERQGRGEISKEW